MKTITKILFTATITFLLGCAKTEVTVMSDGNTPSALQVTKAIGDKCPMISVYIETNDVNPLNAGDYYFEDTGGTICVQYCIRNVYGLKRPVLTLNDKLTNILENGGVEKFHLLSFWPECEARSGEILKQKTKERLPFSSQIYKHRIDRMNQLLFLLARPMF